MCVFFVFFGGGKEAGVGCVSYVMNLICMIFFFFLVQLLVFIAVTAFNHRYLGSVGFADHYP